MGIKRRSNILEVEERVLEGTSTQDVRFEKTRTNGNRRIKSSHRRML